MELAAKINPFWVEIELDGEKLEFLCSPLTAAQRLTAMHLFESGRIGEGALQVVRYTLRDWRGVTRNSEAVPFKSAALDELFASPHRGILLANLSEEIMAKSMLSEDDRKN